MRTTSSQDPVKTSPPLMYEADIGSGEKTPAQHETEEMIRQIPPLPSDKEGAQDKDQAPDDQPPITSPS